MYWSLRLSYALTLLLAQRLGGTGVLVNLSDDAELDFGYRYVDLGALKTNLTFGGLPAGTQLLVEGLALLAVTFLIRLQGSAALSATSVAFAMNLIAFLPTMGIAQAVQILVGVQHAVPRAAATRARHSWASCGTAFLQG